MDKIEFFVDNICFLNKNVYYKVTIEEVDMEKEEKEFIELYNSLSLDSKIRLKEIATYLKVGEKNADKHFRKETGNE